MQNTEAFYAAFARAGFLAMATWQSSQVGTQPVQASVRFTRASAGTFDGMAQGYQASMVFPASQFAGIAKGEAITVATPDGQTLAYRVHEIHLITGGSQREVTLKK